MTHIMFCMMPKGPAKLYPVNFLKHRKLFKRHRETFKNGHVTEQSARVNVSDQVILSPRSGYCL